MQKFDLLIVGAGMVGLTLALAIRKQTSLTVAIVDTAPLEPISEHANIRVSAINLASQTLFENLSVWQDIISLRAQPYQHMHIWDKAGYGAIDFSVNDIEKSIATEQLGWIIENSVIRHALWKKVEHDPNITFFTDSALSNITMGDTEVFASFGEQAPIMAKLLVGADGANSWVRQQMDMPITFKDYDHHAIVATIDCSQTHGNTAWQVFLPTGPLALLPLYNNKQCSIVWSTTPDEAKRLTQLPADEFLKELTAASDGKLGEVQRVSERFTFPLTMRFAQSFVKDKAVLIGDAAHTIHPLAGQGVNLGLLDAAALAQTLSEQTLDSNSSWLNPHALQAFSRWRKSEASDMIVAMASIKEAFAPQNPIVKLLRGVGMSVLNEIKPFKRVMIKQALGLSTERPLLTKNTKI